MFCKGLYAAGLGDIGGGAIVIIGVLLVAVLGIAFFFPFVRGFQQELRYVKNKLFTSRTEGEQKYWENRKKELWLSLLPFRKYDHHH